MQKRVFSAHIADILHYCSVVTVANSLQSQHMFSANYNLTVAYDCQDTVQNNSRSTVIVNYVENGTRHRQFKFFLSEEYN